MVDNSAAKNQLDKTQNTISSLNKISEINSLVNEIALDLSSVLTWANHELYIDNDVRTKLVNIQSRLNTWAWNLAADIQTQYNIYNARITSALSAWRRADPNDISKRNLYQEQLTDPATWRSLNIERRKNEYDELVTLANQFNLWWSYADQTVELSSTTPPAVTIPLNTFCNVIPVENDLCDKDGTPLTKKWSNWEINIWWVTYTLSWITYNRWTWVYDFTHMKVNPSNFDISKPLQLSVTGKYASSTNITIACNKKFNIRLSEWGPGNATERANEIDAYNSAITWTSIVETHLQTKFENEEAQIVRDAISRAVKKINSTTFDSLTDQQKEEFYSRIQETATLPHLVTYPSASWRRQLSAALEHFCTYNDFRNWFANDSRAWNKDTNITRSQNSYRQYFHDHFKDESRKYFDSILDNILNDLQNETYLKAQVNNYLVELEANWRDDDTARANLENPLSRDDVMMEKRRRWEVRKIFRNKDDNYMKFFSWSSKEIKNQTVNISTTTPSNPINTWPIKYDMKIDVPETNKIWVTINIQWQEEITLQSWDYDPVTLARRILREPSISTSKARVHIVYNLYKWLLQLAKEKNIKLEYHDAATWTMREIQLASNWNIVLNSITYWTTPPFRKETTSLFDEQLFQNTNQFSQIAWRNNSLEEWILWIARHFSYAMNRMDSSYRRSTKRALRRWFRSTARMELPTSFWTSPIRKIINKKSSIDFDFSTSVWETHIDLKGNTFTVTSPKYPKPIISQDLWKILHKRVNGKRIFDWVERDIVEAVYSTLIKKMREKNSKIAKSNFWVLDELTGHVYLLDSTGHFWRINRDALNWSNIFNFWWKDWVISEKVLRWTRSHPWYTYHRLTPNEEKELLKNPLLMQWFIKAMNRRMWIVESIRDWFSRH